VALESILFYVLGIIGVVSAILMITRANPVNSALYLIVNFIALAGIYLSLHAQFVAIMQIVVYAGAIMVLVLFVIMLLNLQNEDKLMEPTSAKTYVGIGFGILLLLVIALPIWSSVDGMFTGYAEQSVEQGTVEAIGTTLFSGFALPFELTAMLLLVAMIGAIVLAKKRFP
jgi:NADH-quinone oxidoreductase subunit J